MAEAAVCKLAKETVQLTQQAVQASNVHFTDALTSKGKEDFLDITTQLKINASGMKASLCKHLHSFFEANPALKQDAHFAGLFHSHLHTQKCSIDPFIAHDDDNENISPSTDEQCAMATTSFLTLFFPTQSPRNHPSQSISVLSLNFSSILIIISS